MEIGIVGLGLIGGSLAKAISQNTDNTVYGFDISKPVVHKAMLVNAIEQPLTDELLSQCLFKFFMKILWYFRCYIIPFVI